MVLYDFGMHLLTIIIISYNSASVIAKCMPELMRSGKRRTMIVDNASPDGSARTLSGLFPRAEVIALDKNIGYGQAANIGLRATKTPYALLLNPDLETTTEDIDELLFCAINDTSNSAIWGPATCKDTYTGEPPQEVSKISGSAMLFHVEKIKKVGLFDEHIFLFAEETDLCERTLAAGYKIKLCHDIFFNHLGGQASPTDPAIEYMKWWHFGWSQCYRMTKNGHCTWFCNPQRKQFSYRVHSLTAIPRLSRMKWKAKADGAAAFLRGEKAFDSTGRPKCSIGLTPGNE